MNKQASTYNASTIVCYTSKTHIVLEKKNISYKKKSKPHLVFERELGTMDEKLEYDVSMMNKRTFSGFLGVVCIEDIQFLVFCEEVRDTSSQFVIMEVGSLFFLSLVDEHELKHRPERKKIFTHIRNYNTLLKHGYYISPAFNLTRSLEFQKLSNLETYMWNVRWLDQLKKYNLEKWALPVIQGFVGGFSVFLEGAKINYLLIARRSIHRGGTRYFDRGIDDQGFTANFVQTEQIMDMGNMRLSDVQIRGNVPLFFQQKGLLTKVKLIRDFQLTHKTFVQHIQILKKQYERVFWINLLSLQRKGQKNLIQELQKHIKQLEDDNLKYMYYDFHHETNGSEFQKVDEAITKVRSMKQNLKCFCQDINTFHVYERQKGVFRTNCLDCLDRTNYFQAKLALVTLEYILERFQLISDRDLLSEMNDPNSTAQLIVEFRNLWAEHGDAISMHYTGTPSTHTDVTKNGKRGFFGVFEHKYRSISRFYNQNFWDFQRMKLIDLLLQRQQSKMENETIPRLLWERQDEFCSKHSINIYLLSWKAPKNPPSKLPLPTSPNIIVISIQQGLDDERWLKIIDGSVDRQKYILIGKKVSNHNILVIYGNKSLKERISNIEMTKVKFKSLYNHYLSTKCAVLIRFYIDDVSICVAGCQLEWGREYSNNRLTSLRELHEGAFQEWAVGQKPSAPIEQDDVLFLLGNMNTNISAEWKGSFEYLSPTQQDHSQELINKLLQTDQFSNIQQKLCQYRYYEEVDITHVPTYKYNSKSSKFDEEVSGWVDRIWYSSEIGITAKHYGVVEELRDEHVAVVGSFDIQIMRIDEKKRDSICEQVMHRVSQMKKQAEE